MRDVNTWLFIHSLQPHGLQHTRLPCPSPSPGVCPDSCPLVKHFNIRQMGGANKVRPSLCAFPEVNWWYYCMILYFQVWKSRHRDVTGCGSHSLVRGLREGVSPHWEEPLCLPMARCFLSETDPVPCLSGAALQTREFLLLGGVKHAYPGRVSGSGHFHIHLEALAPTPLLPTHPLSPYPCPPPLLPWSLLLSKGCTLQCYLPSGKNISGLCLVLCLREGPTVSYTF